MNAITLDGRSVDPDDDAREQIVEPQLCAPMKLRLSL